MAKKTARRKKNPGRSGNILIFSAVLGLIVLLLTSIFGEWGVLDVISQQKEKRRLMAINTQLTIENQEIRRKIDRLRNDRRYIENIARHELGMVGDKEMILKVGPNPSRLKDGKNTEK